MRRANTRSPVSFAVKPWHDGTCPVAPMQFASEHKSKGRSGTVYPDSIVLERKSFIFERQRTSERERAAMSLIAFVMCLPLTN